MHHVSSLLFEVVQFNSDLDMFSITERGRESLGVSQFFCNSQPLMGFRLHKPGPRGDTSDFSDYVPFEAMLELSHQGWSYQQRPSSRRIPSYTSGGQKCWFYSKVVCQHYLRVLLQSEKMFSLGLREIFHFQPSSYYKTLLYLIKYPDKLNNVRPWQPFDFYKLVRQQATKCRSESAVEGHGFELEAEPLAAGWGFSCDYAMCFVCFG